MKTWKNRRKAGSSCPEAAVSDTEDPVCSDCALQEAVQIELAEYTINHRAAEILLSRLTEELPPVHETVPFTLIPGESAGPSPI